MWPRSIRLCQLDLFILPLPHGVDQVRSSLVPDFLFSVLPQSPSLDGLQPRSQPSTVNRPTSPVAPINRRNNVDAPDAGSDGSSCAATLMIFPAVPAPAHHSTAQAWWPANSP